MTLRNVFICPTNGEIYKVKVYEVHKVKLKDIPDSCSALTINAALSEVAAKLLLITKYFIIIVITALYFILQKRHK